MKHIVLALLLALLCPLSSTAQQRNTVACESIAKYLSDSLVYPGYMSANYVESEMVVWCYPDTVADTTAIAYLKKSRYYTGHVQRAVLKAVQQAGNELCNGVFIINFDILYFDSAHAEIHDTLSVTKDSLNRFLVNHSVNTYYVTVEEGRQLVNTLDFMKRMFDLNYIPNENTAPNPAYDCHKQYGFKQIGAIKDSIVIRLWRVMELAPEWPTIYQLGLNKRGKWYAKKYRYAHSWDRMPIDTDTLAETIIPTLTKLPVPPNYPGMWTDGLTYYVEVKAGDKCRYYYLNNTETFAGKYGFWIDQKMEEVIKILEGK